MEKLLLAAVGKDGVIANTRDFAKDNSHDHEKLLNVAKSLMSEDYLKGEVLSTSYFVLTDEGKDVVKNGSPELKVFNAIPSEGAEIKTVQAAIGAAVYKIGMSQAMKNRWVKLEKAEQKLYRACDSEPKDLTVELLKTVESKGEILAKDATGLKRRKLIVSKTDKSFKLTKGGSFATERKKLPADLTKEHLDKEIWNKTKYKAYNLAAQGEGIGGGYLHPLLKVREEFRQILLGMGFAEMPTNRWVESSFWNFDALFQPQSHPARDAHDTFFLKGGASKTLRLPEEYYQRVRDMHEYGNCKEKGLGGSIGYGVGAFTREETCKNILRTHTTAISSRMLYELANQEGGFKPQKYFSIDRVFRNETMDATHLCEFHQVEGLVADYDLSLGHLIGVINQFFHQIGITNIRFKPAFNPYTEPSMEIFGYHPTLKKWCELGNSGIFRPEMLLPMGLPENVRVIAWGLSVERPTMIKYNIDNIRTLFGHKIDLKGTKTAPLCRLDEREGPDFSQESTLERAAKAAATRNPSAGAGAGAGADSSAKSAKSAKFAKGDSKAGGKAKAGGAGSEAGSESKQARPSKPHYPLDEMGLSMGYACMSAPGWSEGEGSAEAKKGEEGKGKGGDKGKAKGGEKGKKGGGKPWAKGTGAKKKGGAAADPNQPEITKLDIRVGVITKVWHHETADGLFCEEIDVGEDKPRQIASGLRKYYTLEQMQGKRLLVFCNLKARNLQGFKSHGMVLCADKDGKVEFIDPPDAAKIGERITFGDLKGEPVSPAQVDKKKVVLAVEPGLKTNGDKVACWDGHPFMTSAGPCTAPNLADAPMH